MEIRTRRCTNDDVKRVYDLICELEDFKFNFDKFKECYYSKISDDKNYFVAAFENDNNLIGFISLTIDYQLHHCGKVATIEELIVDSKYRGNSVGTILLKKVIDYSVQNDCESVELTSNFSRGLSHKFYEKNGFTKTSYKFCIRLNKNI